MNQDFNIIFFSSSDFTIPILESIKNSQGQNLAEIAKTQLAKLFENYPKENILPKLENIEKLLENPNLKKKVNLEFVVSQPDRKIRKKTVSNPIVTYCRKEDIEIYTPENINQDVENFSKLGKNIDTGITASFGQILSEKVLNTPKNGMINWHPSLLPKYRGSTPMQTALKNGDSETGLSWIEMTKKMDAGNIFLQIITDLDERINIFDLSEKLGKLGAETWAIATALKIVQEDNYSPITQNEKEVSFCHLLSKEDAFVDPEAMTATEIRDHWRAYLAFPKTKFRCSHFGEVRIVEANQVVESKEFEKLRDDAEKVSSIEETGWIQLKENKKLKTFVKCSKDYLEIKKLGLEGGKTIDFSGFEIGH